MDGDKPTLAVNRNCHKLSHVSWALAQISCGYTGGTTFWLITKL